MRPAGIVVNVAILIALVSATVAVCRDASETLALRELVRSQAADESAQVGAAVERALSRFALAATDARMASMPLDYTLMRTPVEGMRGVYIYTVRFTDRTIGGLAK